MHVTDVVYVFTTRARAIILKIGAVEDHGMSPVFYWYIYPGLVPNARSILAKIMHRLYGNQTLRNSRGSVDQIVGSTY
jgi:hypothetical protein